MLLFIWFGVCVLLFVWGLSPSCVTSVACVLFVLFVISGIVRALLCLWYCVVCLLGRFVVARVDCCVVCVLLCVLLCVLVCCLCGLLSCCLFCVVCVVAMCCLKFLVVVDCVVAFVCYVGALGGLLLWFMGCVAFFLECLCFAMSGYCSVYFL